VVGLGEGMVRFSWSKVINLVLSTAIEMLIEQ